MTVGGTQLFNSAVTGGLLPYTFQWYYTNGTKIIGATNPTLSYKANSTGTYNIYLNVTDSLNVKTQSNTVAIYVYSQPSVLINPTSVKMTIGTLQQFNSTALGGLTPYAYQWYLNDTAVTGATSSVWNFTPTVAGHFKVYLNITDALSFKVQSNIVTDITVYPKPTVSIIPTLVNMIVGTTQTFNSTVQGGAQPFTYQWVLNGTAVAGANSSLWNFTPTQTGHYSVYLNVTDSLNNQAQSNVAADILVYSQLSSINLVSGGSDYTTPVVLITGGGGSGATATARVSNGVIIGIVLTNPGSGYSSAPTVIIRDPSPRAKGASAIAVLGFL
jgi:regulator of sigma D